MKQISAPPIDPHTERERRERASCPACIAQRCHTDEEWKLLHPGAGHGYTKEGGWTGILVKERAEANK